MNAVAAVGDDDLAGLTALLRGGAGVGHKRDIAAVMDVLGARAEVRGQAVLTGDDCAAIADGDGHLLLAIEGFINEFVAREPWFAGYCGVMVNVSDIYAMGGRPLAVVDALWSRDGDAATPLLQGLAAGAAAYGVPIVGGHSNRRSEREQLSVAILGRATRLLTSFDARPGDHLVAAIDLRGAFHEPYAYWDASSGAPPARLRADLEVMASIAEDALALAAKDISMAGVAGTALMLAECSGVGAAIDLLAIPRPPGVALARWLTAFPSFGFLLSVDEARLPAVLARFAARDIACASIGRIEAGARVRLRLGLQGEETTLWDFREQALIGCGPGTEARHAA